MKIPINLKLGPIVKVMRKNMSLFLLVLLVFTLICVAFVVYGEWRKIVAANGDFKNRGQIVRVNLEAHQALEKSLNDNATFEPKILSGTESFAPADK